MSLYLPQRWRRQPPNFTEVNWGHSLAQNLLNFWTYPTGNTAISGLVLWDSCRRGDGVQGGLGTSSGVLKRVRHPTGIYSTPGEAIFGQTNGTGSISSLVINLGANASGAPPNQAFSWQMRGEPGISPITGSLYGTGAQGLQIRGSPLNFLKTATSEIGTANTAATLNVAYDAGLSYESPDAKFYFDGLPDGSASNAQTFALGQDAAYGLGGQGGSEALTNNQYLYYMAIWDRVRPAAEFLAFAENPWQILKPISAKIYSFPAGVAPADKRGIILGSTTINAMNLGNTAINKAYIGSTEIFN